MAPTDEPIEEGTRACPNCGEHVPPLHFCVRCGASLSGQPRAFAAHPGEPARALRVFSTLFPHLPQGHDNPFRYAFGLGVVVTIGLILAGFFPLALVGAAVLVPALFVLYFIEVDLYERAPLAIIGATLAWGVIVGAILASAARMSGGADDADLVASTMSSLPGTVGLALLGAALATAGPLALIRHRAFNDVLDGATFGGISGAVYASSFALVRAGDLFGDGLRPGGDPVPWLIRLATLGIAAPILLAAIVGSVCAAFWLRYRAPVRDRKALGWLGVPALAVVAGLALLGAATGARVVLDLVAGLLATTVAAAIGLVWLRATIHLGLVEEANEAGIGPPTRCANCGQMTPGHTFCGWCGASLQAQPKSAALGVPKSQQSHPSEPAP